MTQSLDDKDSYKELTDKQQRVVDELVDTPTAQNQIVADRADVSRTTVYNVKEKYGHIIESRLDQVGRYDGENTAEGNPFKGELEPEQSWQSISERPAAQDQKLTQPAAETGVVTARLHHEDIEHILLDGDVSDDFRRELVNRVLKLAFDDSD